MSGLLSGKAAVVTGGAQGLGLSIARAMLEEGASVVLGDVAGSPLDEAASSLSGLGSVATAPCDVTDGRQVEALLDTAVSSFGALDVWVNNAGITRDATMRKMTEEQFDAVIAVHLKGTWNGMRAAGARMTGQGTGGAIVNLSSTSGKSGVFGQTNYSAAKAGIVGMTKAAAKELARAQVRVNAIQPGLIRTPMTEAMPGEAWAAKMAEIPLGRAGEPTEVAAVAVFLASHMSSYMTGNVVEVAGGRFM